MEGNRHQKLARKAASSGEFRVDPAVASHRSTVVRRAVAADEADDSGCSVCTSSPEPGEAESRNGEAGMSPSSSIGSSRSSSDRESLASKSSTEQQERTRGSSEDVSIANCSASNNMPDQDVDHLQKSCSCQRPCLCEPFKRNTSQTLACQQNGLSLSHDFPRHLVTSNPLTGDDDPQSPSSSLQPNSSSSSNNCSPRSFPPRSFPMTAVSTPTCQSENGSKKTPGATELFEGSGEITPAYLRIRHHRPVTSQRSLPVIGLRSPRRQSFPGCALPFCESEDELQREDDAIEYLHRQEVSLKAKIDSLERDRSLTLDRSSRFKHDLAEKVREIHALEDKLRENEGKYQDEKRAEELKARVKMAQTERKAAQQLDMVRQLLAQSDEAQTELRASETALRDQIKAAKEEHECLEDTNIQMKRKLDLLGQELCSQQEQHRKEADRCKRTIADLKEQISNSTQQNEAWEKRYNRLEKSSTMRMSVSSSDELYARMQSLEKELADEKCKNDELYSVLVLQGKALVMEETESLAAELEAQSKDELLSALRDEQLHSRRLNHYVGSLLSIVIEKCPELLEVQLQ
ncbi:rab11 family-interacting protein 4-like isoform X2 [Sycon ciliatum]|uniref:rab11 family-interacting protein 4-like isoform X2 n=1 Tax=Sycon ciliatum TaxID=27933 RepID=UPI0031F678A5